MCLKPLSHLSTKAANVAERAALFNSKLRGLPQVISVATFSSYEKEIVPLIPSLHLMGKNGRKPDEVSEYSCHYSPGEHFGGNELKFFDSAANYFNSNRADVRWKTMSARIM